MSHADSAVGQVLAFMAAGIIFVSAMAAVLFATVDVGRDSADIDDATAQREARSIADLIVGTEGHGWTGDADHLTRLGLQNSSGGLHRGHMALLKGGGLDASDNDLVDYEEAARGFGLDPDDGTQFHIRMHPIGLASSLQEIDLSTVSVAYVGEWTSSLSAEVAFDADVQAMADDAHAELSGEASITAQSERDLLSSLDLDFNDLVHIGVDEPKVTVTLLGIPTPITELVPLELLQGDVYPDDKQYLNANLPDRLARYDILYIGSGVQQNTLTSEDTKLAIRDWVHDGGTLMVMGSDSQNVQWLQPLFSVGTSSTNGGLQAPDMSHPLLSEPNTLDWSLYDNHGIGWDLGSEEDQFQTALMEADDATFAVSKDGAYGDGRVFLSTFRPGEIATLWGSSEARGFVHNMVVYSERNDLYLDFGAPMPVTGVPVATSVRHSYIVDEDLGQVPMRVIVHVWRV